MVYLTAKLPAKDVDLLIKTGKPNSRKIHHLALNYDAARESGKKVKILNLDENNIYATRNCIFLSFDVALFIIYQKGDNDEYNETERSGPA
ncbi:MAG: hypothetical protein EBU10_00880 [Alphaproteobacteria bacterium]|jgi:hypothetical protein|nr:hypothetical protein [Alphaproteobacteria bacterium]